MARYLSADECEATEQDKSHIKRSKFSNKEIKQQVESIMRQPSIGVAKRSFASFLQAGSRKACYRRNRARRERTALLTAIFDDHHVGDEELIHICKNLDATSKEELYIAFSKEHRNDALLQKQNSVEDGTGEIGGAAVIVEARSQHLTDVEMHQPAKKRHISIDVSSDDEDHGVIDVSEDAGIADKAPENVSAEPVRLPRWSHTCTGGVSPA